jgi:hypothetical protein
MTDKEWAEVVKVVKLANSVEILQRVLAGVL